ncbi:TlpA family protein disulfide reductase [Alistipes sp. OttesenSCG-928-L06]|nr:TlpA family protein disulfide reductase [Alistipes sp. OttesenSCG-928-L06]
MKKLILSILISLLTVAAAQAQRLVIGERAPEVRVSEWVSGGAAAVAGKPYLLDFFHSSNDQCVANLPKLNDFQRAYSGRLTVVVIARETADKVTPFVAGKGYGFHVGLDEGGKTFANYGVRFVPFAVLVDTKGKLVWTGNAATLSDDIISKAL